MTLYQSFFSFFLRVAVCIEIRDPILFKGTEVASLLNRFGDP